ncbi:MAG: oxidoreductase, partial [Alphaproteobacteria bacterium]|nr:oxidoreductase [Alphaproteobacteria bacterium]
MEDGHHIVVLGGGYAGLTTAARIAEANTGASVTLIDRKTEFVERIRLHEIAAGSVPRDLAYETFMSSRSGDFRQASVSAIDLDHQTLSFEGEPGSVNWDTLVYALGSHTNLDSVDGVREHAVVLDDMDACRSLYEQLRKAPVGTKILIVGGGLTAIEAACEFAERLPDLDVTLAVGTSFAPSNEPGGLSRLAVDYLQSVFDRLKVRVLVGSRVASIQRDAATFEDGPTETFDVCLWAAGFSVPPLAKQSGLAVNETGQIETDDTLASISHPNVLAVGDAAEVIADPGGRCRMSCATGRPMGELAAKTTLGRVMSSTSDPFNFGYSFRCVSLGRKDGLIQFVDAEDCPVAEVWTGARGARWKEYICQRTLQGIGFDVDVG